MEMSSGEGNRFPDCSSRKVVGGDAAGHVSTKYWTGCADGLDGAVGRSRRGWVAAIRSKYRAGVGSAEG